MGEKTIIFEPHNGFGGNDPNGEPWPFGYISTSHPTPLFELRHVLEIPEDELRKYAELFVHSVNSRARLIQALKEAKGELTMRLVADAANWTHDQKRIDKYIAEHPLLTQIREALSEAGETA